MLATVARIPNRVTRAAHPHWLLLVVAGFIGVVGYFGPWVQHKVAGLVIVGLDLAEYVKFLPEVGSGQIVIRREVFYLPLFAASFSAAMLAGRRTLPVIGRVLLAFVAIPLALAMLPPAWSPDSLRTAEYRLQVLAIALCLLMVPGIFATRHLPQRLVLFVIAALGLAAALAPIHAFLLVRPAIATVYSHPLALGWGFWACLFGFLGASVVAMASLVSPAGRS
jgi:hypothetical protein